MIVGLTGGIGSGKSTVAALFTQQGIHVVDADKIAREVVKPGSSVLIDISKKFGSEVVKNGQLDRAKLRDIIFSDPDSKKWLETLLHPLIRKTILNQLSSSSSVYTLLEAPLLFENDLDALCERTIVVDIPEQVQIERTQSRDNTRKDIIEAIIASQMTRENKLHRADYFIDNNGPKEALEAQVLRLHNTLTLLADTPEFL